MPFAFAAEAPPEGEFVAAVLMSDLVDSTQLHARLGDARAAALWAAHDRRARELVRQWHGREVGRSDGFLLLFGHCDDALGFALAYHALLRTLPEPLQARVGLHWGPVLLRGNSALDVAGGALAYDLDGLALPIAARLMGAALGGQTLFSAEATSALGPQVVTGRCSHGHWRLKGVPEPMELVELFAAGAVPMPPPDSAKAYRVLPLPGQPGQWQAVQALPNNLGAEPDPFIGRAEALHAVAAAFEGNARLVTLLGVGGVGKTRSALRYARGWLGSHPGGAWFCDLAAARSVDGIVHAVAQALDVPLGRTDPVQQLGVALAGRGDCLLILDNFEQVARCAEATLALWLQAAPQARFLVTSREVLGLPGEQIQVLAPLPAEEAQAMFRLRLQAAGVSTALGSDDEAALPALVDLLDRLPLAIELAAARARLVPPADQLQRIGERFRLLAVRGGRHDRQATLRATLDWSWDLLADDEKLALAQLSVFEGGFTLAAAEAVVQLGSAPGVRWAADVLQSLLDKSLVRRLHERRFDLLRSVQEYAAERLQVLDPAAVQRHWAWAEGLGEAGALAGRCIELDNLMAACRRAAAEPSPVALGSAVAALQGAWSALRLVGPFRAAEPLADLLLARDDLSSLQRAMVLRVQGGAAGLLGQADMASERYRQAWSLAEQAGARSLAAQLQCLLVDLDVQRGRCDLASEALARVEPDAADDPAARLWLHNSRGNLALATGDSALARSHFERALDEALVLAEPRLQAGLHGTLGAVALSRNESEPARQHLQRGLQLAQALGDRQWAGNVQSNLGLLLHQLGEHTAAREYLEAAVQQGRNIGHRRLEATALCNLGLVTHALGAPDEALAYLFQAVKLAASLGATRLEAQFRAYLGEQLAVLGRGAEAQTCLDTAQTLLGDAAEPALAALVRCARVMADVVEGLTQAARSNLQRAESAAALLPSLDVELNQALARARLAVSRAG